VDGAGKVTGLELLLLAHVEDHGRLVGAAVAAGEIEHLLHLGGIDLLDPGTGVFDQLLPGSDCLLSVGHPKYLNFDRG
jgi:hypothetical protein